MNSRQKITELEQAEHRLNARIEALEKVVSQPKEPPHHRSAMTSRPSQKSVSQAEREHFRQFLMLICILIGVALWMLYLAT
ncbi:MAG: hypothetical protein AAGH89_01840 [Verrucomicrobiota bacterium]